MKPILIKKRLTNHISFLTEGTLWLAMKTLTYTFLFLLFSAVANPLGSATKFWHPEKRIQNPVTKVQIPLNTPKAQPTKPTNNPTSMTQPIPAISKFWHPKLNAQLPPKLEQLKKRLGEKYKNAHITISSGYRSKRHNARLGRKLGFTHAGGRVAKNSAHTRGKAVDLYATYPNNGKLIIIPHQTVAQCQRNL